MFAWITAQFARSHTRRVLKGVGACATGVLLATLFAQTTLFDRLEGWLYDSLQRSLRQATDLDSVIVFDADEESLWRISNALGPQVTDRLNWVTRTSRWRSQPSDVSDTFDPPDNCTARAVVLPQTLARSPSATGSAR